MLFPKDIKCCEICLLRVWGGKKYELFICDVTLILCYQALDDTVSTWFQHLLFSSELCLKKLFSFHLYYHPFKPEPPRLLQDDASLYSAPDFKTIVGCSNTYHNNSNNNNKRDDTHTTKAMTVFLVLQVRKISNALHQSDTDALLPSFRFCCC